jgi:hypothetical protein
MKPARTSTLLETLSALAAFFVVLAAATTTQAQGITATGTFTDTPNGGSFDYVINLQNSASSTSPVGTFWYAWIPGGFFLPSNPSSITAPSGWSASAPSLSGRFSIEFTANTPGAAILPGGSLNFSFTSIDTPATLAGPSAAPGNPPVGLSTLYSGDTPFSGNSLQFNVTPAPEPSSLALLAASLFGFLFFARRKARSL